MYREEDPSRALARKKESDARERVDALASAGRERRGEEPPKTPSDVLALRVLGRVASPDLPRVPAAVCAGLAVGIVSLFFVPPLAALLAAAASGALAFAGAAPLLARARARSRERAGARLADALSFVERLPFPVDGFRELLEQPWMVIYPVLVLEWADPSRAPDPRTVRDMLGLVDEEERKSSVDVRGKGLALRGDPLDFDGGLHRWIRGALERVVLPLHELSPIAHVKVEGTVSSQPV